jgi:ATP phosphoribosyltransferase
MRRLRVGLPKGQRLRNACLGMLQGHNIEFPRGHDFVAYGDRDLILIRTRDLIPLVRSGVLDGALVPHEWILEDTHAHHDREIIVVQMIGGDTVRLAWLLQAAPCRALVSQLVNARFVVTSFPATAAYFMLQHGIIQRLVVTSGSVEAIAAAHRAVGFDVVETGRTAETHGLLVRTVVTTAGLALVARTGSESALREFTYAWALPDAVCRHATRE